VIAAFTYLILTSARGRIRAQLARLRNPRYAIALAFGLFYIWGVYLRPGARPPAESRELISGSIAAFAPLLAFVYVAWTWVFGADRTALAFTEAEVTMLFTAPVSRRALVTYKIARTQLAILTTSLVWTLLFRQGATLPLALTHTLSYWVLLSTLNLNRLGVALIRASGGEHGLRGARRHWLPITVVVAAIAMIAIPLAAVRGQLAASRMHGMADVLTGALGSTSASLALLPFRLLVAPLGATPGREWLDAIVPALLILVLMAIWVLHTDAAFEEAASDASTRQAQRLAAMRARRGGAVQAPVISVRRALPLAPTGVPVVALVWKNAMWLIRTGQLRGLIAPPAIAFLCIALFAVRSEGWAIAIAAVSLVIAFAMLLFGPMSMRNDLRSELQHLSLLKILPLRGRDVVLAEVASSAVPIALTQYLLLLAALVSLGLAHKDTLEAPTRIALAIGAPLLLLGLNGAMFMIHNALALLFPGWVKLGATGASGVETMGVGMMTMLIVLVMMTLMLIAPAIAGAVVWVLFRTRLDLALLVGGIVCGLLLIGESLLLGVSLGGSLERVEPMHVG
jgi:ABC-2 type transport system permease protein